MLLRHIFNKPFYYKLTVFFGNFGFRDLNTCKDRFLISHDILHQLVYGEIFVPIETWYHLAAVYQQTRASIYVNGSLSGSRSDLSASSAVSPSNDQKFFGGNYFSNILLDEIKLYNKALTRDQLLLDMNAGEDMASWIC
jgi:hypothetical protein